MIWVCWFHLLWYMDFWLSESYSKWSVTTLFTGETLVFCYYKDAWKSVDVYFDTKIKWFPTFVICCIINMVFWFWVEWKFFKMESLCFHNGTMILLFLQSYLENNFMYVDVYKLPNKIVFYHILILNYLWICFVFRLNGSSSKLSIIVSS